MDKTRMGEIALLVLKRQLRTRGIYLRPGLKREIRRTSKEIGISYEEGLTFAEILTREYVEFIFTESRQREDTPGGITSGDDVEDDLVHR